MSLNGGSALYLEGMRLMEKEGGEVRREPFLKAIDCFSKGARMYDSQCLIRLREIVGMPKYAGRLSLVMKNQIEQLIQSVTDIEPKVCPARGLFGVFENKPIDHQSGMSFQRNH